MTTAARECFRAPFFLLLLLVGCRESASSADEADGNASSLKDGSAGKDADRTEPVGLGTCLPGASAEDCALCKYGVERCTKACPKTDCSVFPTPAACVGFCAGEPCCQCTLFQGNEYWWNQPQTRMCTSSCQDMERRYKELVLAPQASACAVDQDCLLLFPFQRCDGSAGLGYINNRPINGRYYESSGAKALEAMYRSSCKLQNFVDGGQVSVHCENKLCVAMQEASCL